ncbi:MAG: efflux RND transporter permease subunit [Mangrovibacterium sp.]|nr:efflux RND transporter permease subunit [Mangrovibacterium sp.]
MVEFLIKRPIAVTMTFIAILVLGVFAMKFIPVSLMPDIDIPEITVQVSVANTPARELENTVVQPIRRQLMQVAHLADITSETRNETAVIRLEFDYGADIDFAFIEVNEKIDRAMNYLPREITRPKVIKANATDIPVFYLNLTTKEGAKIETEREGAKTPGNDQGTEREDAKAQRSELYPVSQEFVELSRFSSNVIRKRIEQLPEVAMVDLSGLVSSELLVLPDNRRLESLGITQEKLETLVENSNIRLGNLLIRDGQYQYNIRFSSTLQDKQDIEDIRFKVNDRLLQLKDVARVIEHPQKQKGKVLHNGQDAVTIAVIKQSDAQMSVLKEKLNDLVSHFEKDYPGIRFDITRNQTQLLDYSIRNLRQNLLQGALLAFIVMFFFLKDYKAPLLIGITIPTALIISMLFFYLLGISVNIISLAGIILGVGMMTDNSIVVIDNITQHRERNKRENGDRGPETGKEERKTETGDGRTEESKAMQTEKGMNAQAGTLALIRACVTGTNEVFSPLLSAMFTTCAVYIPLVFISGITGAMFYDQAVAVTVGQLASLAVAVTLIPVYYRLLYKKEGTSRVNRFLERLSSVNYEKAYMKGFKFVMRHQVLSWALTGVLLAGAAGLFLVMEKTKLPPLTRDEILLNIDWNERVHIDGNKERALALAACLDSFLSEHTCLIGEQQFMMDKGSSATSSEVVIYLKTNRPDDLQPAIRKAGAYLHAHYPQSLFGFIEAGNIFNMIFSDREKPLVARLRAVEDYGPNRIGFLEKVLTKIRSAFPGQAIGPPALYEYTVLHTDPARLLLYDVTFSAVYSKLKSAFNENQLLLLTDNQDFVPVILGDQSKTIGEIIGGLFVANSRGELIPVRNLVTESKGEELKTIMAGKEGEYYPVALDVEGRKADEAMKTVRGVISDDRSYEATFTGSILSNRELVKELSLIFLISLALLFFILASQFESLTLPLIVLMEIPVDVFGALLMLKLGGEGINLMSMIGMVVMTGIIINDSILKVDTMNQLVKEGYPLVRAVAEAGHRRLKPILMTSLTSVLALVPLLFTSDLGSELQKPLALAVIGGMTLGTLVSLFLVPLAYYYLKKS